MAVLQNSNLASVRLRAGCMATHASKAKFRISAGERIHAEAKTVIIGKIGAYDIAERSKNWLDQIWESKERGAQIIMDFTDNHLDTSTVMTGFYKSVLPSIDSAVCSSSNLKSALARHWSGAITCIPDALEVDIVPPKKYLCDPRTMLWFGHGSNLAYLLDIIPMLQVNICLKLIILSNVDAIKSLLNMTIRVPPNLRIEAAPWSISSMIKSAKISDLCIIPSDRESPRKSGVSSNRLITSLALGLPTAANMMDSYVPYSKYFVDLEGGSFFSLLQDPLSFTDLLVEAQADVLKQFSMENLSEYWCELCQI